MKVGLAPPSILAHPRNLSSVQGQTAKFEIVVTGTGPFEFLWFKNGVPLILSNEPLLELESVNTTDNGIYSVLVTNRVGDPIRSDNAILTVDSFAAPAEIEPFSPNSILPDQSGVHLKWDSIVGVVYRVQVSSDLLNWENVTGEIVATGESTGHIDDQRALNDNRLLFYRIVAQ